MGLWFQLKLSSVNIQRNEAAVEKCNSLRHNQENGCTWDSWKELLCFPFDVRSSTYFECPTLIEGVPDSAAEWSTCSSSTEVLQDHHLTLTVAKPTGYVLFLCIVCNLGPCLVGFPPWSQAPCGCLLEGQSHPGPSSLVGLEAEQARLAQACNITDVTLWFPISALKYSKLTKATVEFRTNTGGMFSYLFL